MTSAGGPAPRLACRSCSRVGVARRGPLVAWPLIGAATRASAAAADRPRPAPTCAPLEEWQADFQRLRRTGCTDVSSAAGPVPQRTVPDAPDSGLAGWFAARPELGQAARPQGLYSDYGYAGYTTPTYDIGRLRLRRSCTRTTSSRTPSPTASS